MQKRHILPERHRLVAPIVAAQLLCASGLAAGALADDGEKQIAMPVSAYEKLLSRMERMERELKSLKSGQAKQAKKQKALESRKPAQQVVVVERAGEGATGSDPADDSQYIPTGYHGGVYAPGGARSVKDTPTRSTLGAYYGEAGVTVLKLFGNHNIAIGIDDSPNIINGNDSRTFPFDHSFDAGGRYEVGYKANSGLGWAARYWHYRTSAEASLTNTGDGRVQVEIFDEPDIEMMASQEGDRIDAQRTLSFRTLDLEASLTRRYGDRFRATYTGGLRFADVTMNALWSDFEGGVDLEEYITVRNSFKGLGPVLGANLTGQIYQRGAFRLDAFGVARASLLYGRGDFEAYNGSPGGAEDFLDTTRDGLVVTSELQLGLEAAWALNRSTPLELYARGYLEAQYWGGVGSVASTEAAESDGGEGNALVDANQGMIGGTFMFGVRTPLGK